MQHLDEGTIHSWLDGALSADEAAHVEAHVKECPQCAAAVAEARGFIAASSRILTALDNAPRGVIPVAVPKKRVDPIVWRVAATLLVVAGGTLVVFRNGRNGAADRDQYSMVDSMPARTTPQPAAPIIIQGNPPRGIAIDNAQPSAAPSEKPTAKTAAPDVSTATEQTSAALAPRINYSAKASAPASQTNIPPHGNKAVAGEAGDAVANKISASSAYAQAAPPSPQLLSAARVGSAAALTAASETAPLKVIGTPRKLGAKVTLYEVSPGDTVTLTEAIPLALNEVVVTGAGTASTARQATGKSATAPSKVRANAGVITSMADSQHAAGALSSAPVVSAPAPTSQVGMVNAFHTITWTDSTTGNTLALTGRMSEAQLQQIRIRIERERAAAAANKRP
jgi:Putative zinc-finger